MKKVLKRIKTNTANKFTHLLLILNKLLKVSVQSMVVCFPATILLIVVNSLFGVHIRLSYYLNFALLAVLGVSIVLSIFNWKYIVAKPVRPAKRNVASSNNNRRSQRSINRKRRNIS